MTTYGKFNYHSIEILFTGDGNEFTVSYLRGGKTVGETLHNKEFAFKTAKSHFENCVHHAMFHTEHDDIIGDPIAPLMRINSL